MAEPRKIFRIEQMAATRLLEDNSDGLATLRHAEVMRALAGLRSLLTPPRPESPKASDADAARLIDALKFLQSAISGSSTAPPEDSRMPVEIAQATRISRELGAIVEGAEQATQRILAAAEEIEQAATALAAALKGGIQHSLAEDIQELVIPIFEACNFQDLIGQRVAKVMAMLHLIEDHITRVLGEQNDTVAAAPVQPPAAPRLLHGPRLDVDHGHATQGDIDAMFEGRR